MKGTKMKLSVLPLLFLLLVTSVLAQTFSPRTDTFAFNNQSAITSWNGSDPSNPPYPYGMGAVCLTTQCGGGYGSGIEIPFELGYLNNGFLSPCDPITFSPKTWVIGDGTHSGDAFIVTGSTLCPYFTGEYGSSGNSGNILDGFSVTVKYVRQFQRFCGRTGCHNLPVDTLQSGTGVAQQTEITPQ
jgi:hypothetical protein